MTSLLRYCVSEVEGVFKIRYNVQLKMYYFKTLIFVQYLSVTIVDKLESRMKEIWRMSEISVLRHYSRK